MHSCSTWDLLQQLAMDPTCFSSSLSPARATLPMLVLSKHLAASKSLEPLWLTAAALSFLPAKANSKTMQQECLAVTCSCHMTVGWLTLINLADGCLWSTQRPSKDIEFVDAVCLWPCIFASHFNQKQYATRLWWHLCLLPVKGKSEQVTQNIYETLVSLPKSHDICLKFGILLARLRPGLLEALLFTALSQINCLHHIQLLRWCSGH